MISATSMKEIFQEQSIASIAIIDDAFNPAGSSLTPAERDELFTLFSADGDIVRAFDESGLELGASDDITAAALKTLRARGQADAGATAALAHVSVTAKGKRVALDVLASALKSLGAKVSRISANRAQAARKNVVSDDVDVVLLDYDLEGAEDVGELSRRLAGRIYEQFKDRERAPLVILMSSNELDEDEVRKFQTMTKVLGGMFYFVPKADLFDEERRNYRLAAFAKSLTTGQALQRFVVNVEKALEETRDRVFADVRALSISDFAYLKMLRLHDDGQPLGEYLIWLLSAHIVKNLGLSEGVALAEEAVNALAFDQLPPTQAKPSPNLAVLYSSAVMRPMPVLPENDNDGTRSLQFGDLFRKGKSKRVWLCITPPCDLAFSQSRPKQSDRSILFLPGTLRAIEDPLKPFDLRQPRTELLWLDDKIYRVLWDTKRVDQAAWGKIREWQTDRKVTRIARVNTPFALEIQRNFAADLTRVGMPTPPPLYNPQLVRLHCLDDAGAPLELSTKPTRDALSVGGDRGVRLILGEEFMNGLPAMLKKAEKALTKRLEVLKATEATDGPGPAAEAVKALEAIAQIAQDAKRLSAMRGPFVLPEIGKPTSEMDGAMYVCHEADLGSVAAWVPLRLEILAPIEEP